MKKIKLLYFILPVWTILMCIPFEINASRGLDIQCNAMVLYIFRMIVVLFSLGAMVSAFTILKEKLFSQLLLLNVSALWVVIDYYLNLNNPGSDNLLWLLPMIIVVYIIRYKAVSNAARTIQDQK